MSVYEGIDLVEGLARLARETDGVWWFGQSMFLCAGCEDMIPGFSHVPVGVRPAHRAGGRVKSLGFLGDPATTSWADETGTALAMPDFSLVGDVGDKLRLPGILAAAGVAGVPSVVVALRSGLTVPPEWRDGALVAQLPENDTTGAGTRLVEDIGSLEDELADWGGRTVKLSPFLHGISLTASGCVLPDAVVVSGLSQQLVGLAGLTTRWGAHCGNQLLNDDDLTPSAAENCRTATRRVGEELRRRGFLGMFGLDLILTATGDIHVVEINPRVQSVSSLINSVERENGLLPTPGAQILAFCGGQSATRRARVQVPDHSQIVWYAPRDMVVGRVSAGRVAMVGGTVVGVAGPRTLNGLGKNDALVWPFARPGQHVVAGTKVAVVQFARRVATLSERPALTIPDWLDALASAFTADRNGAPR